MFHSSFTTSRKLDLFIINFITSFKCQGTPAGERRCSKEPQKWIQSAKYINQQINFPEQFDGKLTTVCIPLSSCNRILVEMCVYIVPFDRICGSCSGNLISRNHLVCTFDNLCAKMKK